MHWTYFAAFGCLIGVLLREYTPLLLSVASLVLGVSILIGVYVFKNRSLAMLVAVLVVAGCISFAISLSAYESFVARRAFVEKRFVETGVLDGLIISDPDVRADSVIYIVDVDEAKVRVSLPRLPRFKYGDRIRVAGTLERPESFITEAGATFDYERYLRAMGVVAIMTRPHVEVLSSEEGSKIVSALFATKRWIVESVGASVMSPHAELAAGMLVGSKQGLGEELTEAFREAGLVHVIVLSGFNVAIVIASFSLMFSRLPVVARVPLVMTFVIAFAVMVGGGATVARASVMALIGLLARESGYQYDALRALCAAGVLMVLQNPHIVAGDPSFQLSFVATLGLMVFSSPIGLLTRYLPNMLGMREALTQTVSAQIATYPLIARMAGSLSWQGVVANCLVAPVIPFTMLSATTTALLSWIPYVGMLPAFATVVACEFVLTTVRLLT